MRRMLFTVVMSAALAAVASACNRTGAEPDAAALTSEPFFLRGTISETSQPGGFLMKGEPGSSYKTDRAYFRVGSDTEITRPDGTAASVADLTVGRQLTLWITGPVAESYPVQVRARKIVLE